MSRRSSHLKEKDLLRSLARKNRHLGKNLVHFLRKRQSEAMRGDFASARMEGKSGGLALD